MPHSIIVLAGGWSVTDFNLQDIENYGTLIAVNDAALYTKCDIALTMDRLWIEGRQQLLRVLNPPEVWYRAGTPKNFVPPPHWNAFSHDGDYPTQMMKQRGKLNGSNSGTCALNLAFQWSPDQVFLMGFDMQRGPGGEKHWYPDYPWVADVGGTKRGTYMSWALEFDSIAAQFKAANIPVFNVGDRSLITSFPKITFEEFQRQAL